ncbi:PQQ-dependent sugar dehydrogenase [Orrella daihaiensis]|uniref:PQQ-dependent sugar dehydrogenase n=1 Tax=Orrella daihaiensis TaxID=2782176 RepID=A0ABY4AM79_9BURK|nr:PQQ-dependent sugar dehydrogenase [Orrella daihaiensis]UOD50726.1 PQQ-dependent sugar dehydrogenase [Orrella daihaiensis]
MNRTFKGTSMLSRAHHFAVAALTSTVLSFPALAVQIEVVATGLAHPWAVAFVGEGQMLVTERAGRLRLVDANGSISGPLTGLPAIAAQRQGGLLDVVTDRDFARNRTIYFCYSRPDPTQAGFNSTALAAARLSDDAKALENVRDLFVQSPSYRGGFHFGCRIVQGPDGKLWMGLGDRYQLMQEAQNTANEIGKVVRINQDGSIPADNPFAGKSGASAAVWSYGHRNIQGATLDSEGRLWMTEHGPQGGDELNLIQPGLNYGWPVITYGENYGGGQIGDGITEAPGMQQPAVHWTPSIAPSGLAFVDSDRYGQAWKGNLMLGSLKFGNLVRVALEGDRVVDQEVLLPELRQRVRDVRLGPDGFLYILTDSPNGQLIRLKP